jgi:hypothetical protein
MLHSIGKMADVTGTFVTSQKTCFRNQWMIRFMLAFKENQERA